MSYQGVVLDLDGTVYRNDEAIPGARKAVETLRERGIRLLCLSNNPTETPEAYAERLAGMGIDVDESEIASAGSLTTTYLKREHPEDRIFLVGAPGLRAQFEAAGLDLVAEWDAADVLVASYDRAFDYETLTEAFWALDAGATFIGTDPDVTVPQQSGRVVPGSGAIVGAIALVADRDPDIVCGKPAAEAMACVDRVFEFTPEECLVVGDRLDTDIELGARYGADTAIVCTGVTDEADLGVDGDPDPKPDHVLPSIADLETIL